MRRLSLLFLLVVSACENKPSAPPPPRAELRTTDAGAELVVTSKTLALADVDPGAPEPLSDATGTRFAYVTRTGEVRLVYAIGDGLWFGPKTKPPVDWQAVPSLDDAVGAIFVEAGPKRPALTDAVRRALGDSGVARMLGDSPEADGPEWDAIFGKLTPAQQDEAKLALGKRLQKGQPTGGLVRVVGLAKLSDAATLDARVRELATQKVEPGATGVMLRALSAIDGAKAAQAACATLAAKPDAPAVLDAALFAIARDVLAGKPLACEADVAAALEKTACQPSVRCAGGKPLTGRETTKQDEPLCTKAELDAAVASAAAEPPLRALETASRPALFGYAALLAAGKVPPAFEQAHARRRYAIAQPSEPACDSGVAIGAPCRCDEPALRDLACRNLGSDSGHVGACKFALDDKQKKIVNVTAAIGPL